MLYIKNIQTIKNIKIYTNYKLIRILVPMKYEIYIYILNVIYKNIINCAYYILKTILLIVMILIFINFKLLY